MSGSKTYIGSGNNVFGESHGQGLTWTLSSEYSVPIKPCPFCKSQLVHVANARGDCFVECLSSKCKAQGPTGSTPFEAIKKWNAAPREE